jgi:quercetin dioxygenase-like cupin family protein
LTPSPTLPRGSPEEKAEPLRSLSLKLRGSDTADSVMMFEETLPTGTKSVFHLHHDSDEVAYVLRGEITFMIDGKVTVGGPGICAFMPRGVPHAWKATGPETSHVLFLYTPAKAGGLIEEQQRTGRKFAMMGKEEMDDILDRHGWMIVGPSPLET